MRYAPLLSIALVLTLLAPVQAAEPPANPPTEPPSGVGLLPGLMQTGVATATSALVLGLGYWDGGKGAIGSLGQVGQIAFLGGAAALPPAAMVAFQDRHFALDDYFASFTGGLLGLGIGFAATRAMGGQTPTPTDMAVKLAATSLGQGLGSAIFYQLYQLYKPGATDLNQLPAERHDDPLKDWDTQRKRRPE